MNRISEITKRDIFNLFTYGKDIEEFFETKRIQCTYYGRLSEIDFLKRIYKLQELPSYDNRFNDAEGDIWQHTINNDDYDAGWIFEDDRFELLNGKDEVLLSFLCAVYHPAVRVENGYWKEFLQEVNGLLQKDGYEIYPASKISGRDVFDWKTYNPEEKAIFIPFSERHKSEISDHKLKLTISRKIHHQIYQLLLRHTENYRETDETGWQYNITTSDCVFRDLSQFYTPKCYDDGGKYSPTSDFEQFIIKTTPYCVLDAIEVYEKYNQTDSFSAQINSILTLNDIPYSLNNGMLENTLDVKMDNSSLTSVQEVGLKELLIEAAKYYSENNKKIAVEKIRDAFERLKTYYSPTLNKPRSADKIIEAMSGDDADFKAMFEAEFKELTTIGNNFRIRHHETTKTDITDDRQYDYFYKRCMALLSVAILYL